MRPAACGPSRFSKSDTNKRAVESGKRIIETAWLGCLWCTGYLTAPALFSVLDDRALAGQLAGHLFHLVTLLSVVCGSILLLSPPADRRTTLYRGLALAIVVLLAANEWGVRPWMDAARLPDGSPGPDFGARHGVSAVLYLAASLLGAGLLLARSGRLTPTRSG